MQENLYIISAIAVAAICTFATRAIPFALFGGKRQVPKTVTYLGHVLPPAIIAVLIIYCIRNVNFLSPNHGASEIIAILSTALLHIIKGNTLISIGGGTVIYMFLVQYIFI